MAALLGFTRVPPEIVMVRNCREWGKRAKESGLAIRGEGCNKVRKSNALRLC